MSDTLKALRLQQGLTQSQLAAKIPTSTNRICYWETGQQTPHLDLQVKCARALNVQLHELQRIAKWPVIADLLIVSVGEK